MSNNKMYQHKTRGHTSISSFIDVSVCSPGVDTSHVNHTCADVQNNSAGCLLALNTCPWQRRKLSADGCVIGTDIIALPFSEAGISLHYKGATQSLHLCFCSPIFHPATQLTHLQVYGIYEVVGVVSPWQHNR